MKVRQAYIRSEEGGVMTTFLDDRPDLKVGSIISLKDYKPEIKWIVEFLSEHLHDASDFEFHRKWDNNNYDKHKGLGI
jgi:hypothetical protein